MKKIIPALFCIAFVFSTTTASARGKRLVTRITQAIGFKVGSHPLRSKTGTRTATRMQTLLTGALACAMFSCAAVKPHDVLYTLGVLNPSSAMQAETIADAVLAARRDFDHEGEGTTIIHNHVYAIKSVEPKVILAEVVKDGNGVLTLRRYTDKYEMTVISDAVEGYLLDDHPHIGRIVELTSDAVGISHLNGAVFAVYTNGIHAIKIFSKTDLDGKQEALHRKDDAPHVRFAYEHQLR